MSLVAAILICLLFYREDAEKALKKSVVINNEKVIAVFADPTRKNKKGKSSENNTSQSEDKKVSPKSK